MLILVQLGRQKYSYLYLYGQIALAIACAITSHTRTSKSADDSPNNCTQKCVIYYICKLHKAEPSKYPNKNKGAIIMYHGISGLLLSWDIIRWSVQCFVKIVKVTVLVIIIEINAHYHIHEERLLIKF